MKIASRFDDKYKFEKCPSHTCLMIGQNFALINEFTLGCLRCGNSFLAKSYRDSLDVKGLLEAQERTYECEVCHKTFEHKIALTGHMRGKCGKSDGS